MNKGSTPALLVPLLALLAILFPVQRHLHSSGEFGEPSLPAVRPPEALRDQQIGVLGPHSAGKLIEDFLQASSSQYVWPEDRKYSLDFVIATIPDPVDSRLPYFFDSSLDSIQRACEASGYVLDRFDLAWPQTPAGNREKRTPENMFRYRSEPGVLLFRGTDRSKLLVIFLVGETPTGGLHKDAMASALRQVANLSPWGPEHSKLPEPLRELGSTDSPDSIKILGPTFSGSAVSLELALGGWLATFKNPPVHFRIVSGTATAIDPQRFFRFSGTRFQAVVPPDTAAIPRILSYVQSLGYARVAMLSEASTSYGQTNMRDTRLRNAVLSLPFPLHISQLRTLSEKQRLAQQKSGSEAGASPAAPIPLEEGDAAQPKEMPPSYSPLEVSAAELVLSRLLSTISREEIHAVGILATDVRDTIFLAREIRQHCPSTLIFTVNSDLLYTHADASSSTRGMLVFTPYPLFDLNQVWTPPSFGEESRLQFSNQAAEGIYNATLALLGQTSRMLEYGKPFESGSVAEPALWVTSVGRSESLPVRILDLKDHSDYSLSFSRSAVSPTAQGIYTAASAVGMVLVSILLIAFSLLVIRQYRAGATRGRESKADWVSRLLAEPFSPAYQLQANLYLLACTIALLSVYVVLSVVYWLPEIAAHRLRATSVAMDWRWIAALAAAAPLTLLCLVLLTVAAAVLVRAFWKALPEKNLLPIEVKCVVLIGSAAALSLALALAVTWLRETKLSPPEAFFVHLRAFAITSGLSPLVPLFCVSLAAFLWGFCSFRRLRMIDGIRSRQTGNSAEDLFLTGETPSFDGVQILEKRIRDLLERASAFPNRWYLGLVSLAALAGAYLFIFRFVPSYESRAFYALFGSAFVLVYSALAMEFGRLWLIWGGLRRFLRRLNCHPMRDAYARYRLAFPGLPNIDLATAPPIITVLAFSVDQAERLLRSASSLVSSKNLPDPARKTIENWLPEAGPEVHGAAESLSQALEAEANGDWRTAVIQRSRSQRALGEVARMAADFLEPFWRADACYPLSLSSSPELKNFCERGEEFLAGRAVLLISYILPALRNLGAFVLSGLLLMLISVVFYPFEPRNQFLAFNWIVILSFVGLALVVLLQMERDVILSSLNGTTPGQVTMTRQFTLRVLTYVMVPIFALLGAQFPDTVGQIVSWFGTTPGH